MKINKFPRKGVTLVLGCRQHLRKNTSFREASVTFLHKMPRKLERWQWEKGELVTGQWDGEGMGQSSEASCLASTSLGLALDGQGTEAHSGAGESLLL